MFSHEFMKFLVSYNVSNDNSKIEEKSKEERVENSKIFLFTNFASVPVKFK